MKTVESQDGDGSGHSNVEMMRRRMVVVVVLLLMMMIVVVVAMDALCCKTYTLLKKKKPTKIKLHKHVNDLRKEEFSQILQSKGLILNIQDFHLFVHTSRCEVSLS